MADNYTIDTTGYKSPNYGYEGLKYVKGKDNFDRSKMPASGANPVTKVPDYWKSDLPNGIKMIGAKYDELPIVNISITFPGGHLAQGYDTAKIGLAGFTASMLNEDTKNFTAEQISVALQKLGSSVSVYNTKTGMVFSMQSLSKNLDKTLEILQERLMNPNFTKDAFTRLQKQAMEGFKQEKSQPASIASNVYRKLNYGADNILGMSDNGTEYTIKNLTIDDVSNFYNSTLNSQGTKVVIVGNLDKGAIMNKLAFLNKLPNISPDAKSYNPVIFKPSVNYNAIEKTKIYLVDVPKAAQTEFRVGKLINMPYDLTGEYYQSVLMNYVLGANFNSRLNLNLREDKGWTYGARANFSGDKHSVEYTFSSGIRANATDSALTEVLKEINNYAKDGIKEDEIKFMKNAIGQNDALQYETPGQKSGFVAKLLEYNLEGNYIDKQNEILNKISQDDINALAKKWLQTDKMNILLVGDKEKILPGLAKFGYEIIELDVDGNRK
jgi:zinc protease